MANTKWRRTQKGLPRICMEELSPLQKEELTLLCFCEQSVDGQLGFSMGVGGLPWGLDGKESAYRARDLGSVAGWEDPLEKGMASHSRSVAWRMPWTEEPGGLQSVGSQRVRHAEHNVQSIITLSFLETCTYLFIIYVCFFCSQVDVPACGSGFYCLRAVCV